MTDTQTKKHATATRAKKHAPLILIVAGLATVLWASAFPAIKVALKEFSPYHVALLRYGVASVALAVVALAKRLPLPAVKDLPAFLLLGFVGFTVYNIALNYGQVTVPAATSSFIVASAPIWMAIIAALFLGEKLKPFGWFGIILSFIGVGIIALGSVGGIKLNVRALAILGASMASALYSLGQKPLLKRYSPLQIVTYAIWCGTLLLMPFGGGVTEGIRNASLSTMLSIIYMGVFPGAIGYILWSMVLSRMPASKAGVFLYMIPVIALVISWLWIGEIPSLISALGGVLIVAGVITVNTAG
ncbi:MAG TPA: EamA family transporter [Firmicutes bacterium]|jgi:drug/metabolite transporter (DMT)-like permease|nr:EamA family transporter [Bacillota bacterium]HAZ22690.1 EamA family transporter [Bacillota bacterium]HBE05570.1 EamA family transporter [Bacillota bacterium]HBG42895.1 EamA family transporter [Bacillota bacterium]HBL48923.1 EamA family transporter [Bacillota bacterium]